MVLQCSAQDGCALLASKSRFRPTGRSHRSRGSSQDIGHRGPPGRQNNGRVCRNGQFQLPSDPAASDPVGSRSIEPNSGFKPRRIADLGCGPGHATALLARRFGDAKIVGVDDSEEMLEQAKARLPEIQFDKSDIGRWNPTEPFDLIFSNLTLQNWPRLRPFLPRLLSLLEDGGLLAVQIPNNLHEPNRVLVRMLAADGPWAKQLLPIAKSRPFNETVEGLYSADSAMRRARNLGDQLRLPPRRRACCHGVDEGHQPRAFPAAARWRRASEFSRALRRRVGERLSRATRWQSAGPLSQNVHFGATMMKRRALDREPL